MRLLKQLRYDFYAGTRSNRIWYIGFAVIILSILFMFKHKVDVANTYVTMTNPSFLDYVIEIMKGKKILQPNFIKLGESFSLPAEWVFMQFYLYLMLSIYPKKDFEVRGYQFFIRSQSIYEWWISKCIWVIVNILLYYAIFYGMVFICCMLQGNITLGPNIEITKVMFGIDVSNLNLAEIFVSTIGTPVLASIALGMIELGISFLFTPTIAVLIILIYLVMSVYYCNPYMIGNYTQVYRNALVVGSGGVGNVQGILICCFLILFNMIVGYIFLKHTDLIHRQDSRS